MQRCNTGFSLLELLIALTIVGILALFAIPAYTTHITHAHRISAEIALEKLAASLEQYQTINNTYEQATLANLDSPEWVADHTYQLSITRATASDFHISANASPAQEAKDPLCGSLTLNSNGEKGITGQGQLTDCWS